MKRILISVLLIGFFTNPSLADERVWIDASSKKIIAPKIEVPSFAPLIRKLSPSVVNISIEGKQKAKDLDALGQLFQMPQNKVPTQF